MSFVELSCADFVEVLASKKPVPGGGGASALVGAIGLALGNMVGSLTLGKPNYTEVEADIIELKEKADSLQASFLELVDRDAEAYTSLLGAYMMPTDTEEEKAEKTQATETYLRLCCEVPFSIMKRCAEAIDLHEQFAEKGTDHAISDVGCGVLCCKAALLAASLNVFINTRSMLDQDYAENINVQVNALVVEYTMRADAVFEAVVARLSR